MTIKLVRLLIDDKKFLFFNTRFKHILHHRVKKKKQMACVEKRGFYGKYVCKNKVMKSLIIFAYIIHKKQN